MPYQTALNNIFGKIKDGVITPDKMYAEDIKKSEGKDVMIVLDPDDLKSKMQLGYFFGVVCKIVGDELGLEPYEVYELLLTKLPREYTTYHKSVMGKIVEFKKRISGMAHKEMGKFIEASVQYCRQSPFIKSTIPDPDKDYKND